MSLLEIRDLRGGHPGTTVLDGIDLDVAEGFDGREIAGRPTDEIARAGIAIVPQGRRVFGPLTTEENLGIAYRRSTGGAWRPADVYALFPRRSVRRDEEG